MLESDADRRDMLLAVGGQVDIRVADKPLSIALFTMDPLDLPFEGLRISSTQPFLACLMSEAKRLGLKSGDQVQIPEEAEHYVANITNEAGLAVIELRSDP